MFARSGHISEAYGMCDVWVQDPEKLGHTFTFKYQCTYHNYSFMCRHFYSAENVAASINTEEKKNNVFVVNQIHLSLLWQLS